MRAESAQGERSPPVRAQERQQLGLDDVGVVEVHEYNYPDSHLTCARDRARCTHT